VPTDAERDPVEWAQHTALVAISVARTVLDLAEAAVTDRERLERLATTGRSFAEAWLGDAARLASTVVSGLGLEPDADTPASPSPDAPAGQPAKRAASKPTAARAAGSTATKRPAKRATPRSRAKPAKAAKAGAKSTNARKATPVRPKPRKK
jgi:hypothetical protein